MREREKKLMRSKRNNIVFALTTTLALCVYVAFSCVKVDIDLAHNKEQLERCKTQKKSLEIEKETIEKQKEEVNSKEYIEEMARKKLGLVYKDEVIFESEE